MARSHEFEPRGLPGWSVFLYSGGMKASEWMFEIPADFPDTFGWSDEAQDHVVPKYGVRTGPFSGPPCRTASAAVAAAHRQNEWTRKYAAEKGIAI